MSATKYVIVNADDFGQSAGVNCGIVRAHEEGLLTSASLMVRWPAAAAAAAYGRAHPRLSVGLHLDFGEWVCREGTWMPLYEVVSLADAAAVAREVKEQVATFHALMGRAPTHLDSHQHAHLEEPVRSAVREVADHLRVPVRRWDARVRYCGNFYGQMNDGTPLPELLTVEGLLAILRELSAGITELGCHPGEGSDLETMYRDERAQEVRVLCDPRLRAALPDLGITLCSFHDVDAIAARSC